MLEFLTFTPQGRLERHDLHALPLPPDGTLAHQLSGAALYRRLAKLKVPGISINSGQQDLLLAYSKHLAVSKIDQVTGKPAPAEGNAA
jgi:hypothetical protein